MGYQYERNKKNEQKYKTWNNVHTELRGQLVTGLELLAVLDMHLPPLLMRYGSVLNLECS